ncbi:hypothetical protein B0I18_10282 [Taibaiella chishuiensis]|uniref:Uncharacterized protein n=1 Tax=Taibaiella chishuiensis TaxID=1434707 RepID=A0A2P8D7C8_9BACT|nr:hypothetical protein B0I18_10282 [Taibaiella chishuiensis]
MKYTGFIKEYDPQLSHISIDDFFGNAELNSQRVDGIINYLSHGILEQSRN